MDATLNIFEFNQIVIHFILSNNKRLMGTHPQTAEDVARDRIPAIPIELWNWGIENRTGRLRHMDKQAVYLALLPSDNATVTKNGIRFHSIYYTCDTAMRENWFAQARTKKSWPVRIKYDPRNLENIYLIHDNRQIEACVRTQSSSESLIGYLEDVIYHEQTSKETAAAYRGPSQKDRLDSRKAIEAIVSEAKKEGKVIPIGPASQKKKVSDIKDNRKKELESIRKKETAEMGIAPSNQIERASKIVDDVDDNPYAAMITCTTNPHV